MFETKGLDKLIENLETLTDRAEKLDGTPAVPIQELLNDKFISEYTTFTSFDNFASGLPDNVENLNDLETPDNQAYITSNSKFSSTSDFLESAVAYWTNQQLFQGF
ncbi:hypothetical protein [Weissella tructae]|uniref:hypothetical protein n=1 Tax=Weissella tructae TaxID=887702 RepID=UPI001BDD61E1|nr:hypothetical protein [Weissella tructae]QVV90855.1 hypothetical protein KHQ32_04270 [Weissella tructae]